MTTHDRLAIGSDTAEPAEGLVAADGLDACYVWYRVLTAQADRLAQSGFVPDGYVFVVALRNLRRAAVLVASTLTRVESRAAAAAAMAEFDRALPGVEEARDAFEHFDDYARGVGALPGDQRVPRRPVTVDLRTAPGGRTMVLSVDDVAVPVDEATTAACLLLADVHAAAHADLAHPHHTATAPRDGAAHRVLPHPPELAA